MKNYQNSDYALNKFSKGIVYRFVDKIVEVTLDDFLRENPNMTSEEFNALKKYSDNIYLDYVRNENTKCHRNISFCEIDEVAIGHTSSPEDMLIDDINRRDESDRRARMLGIAYHILERLTEVQRRRYLMHHVGGLTMRQIADIEGVGFSKIQKSLMLAEIKINKILAKG